MNGQPSVCSVFFGFFIFGFLFRYEHSVVCGVLRGNRPIARCKDGANLHLQVLSRVLCAARVREREYVYFFCSSTQVLLEAHLSWWHCVCCSLLSFFACAVLCISLSMCVHVSNSDAGYFWSFFLCLLWCRHVLRRPTSLLMQMSTGVVRTTPFKLWHARV